MEKNKINYVHNNNHNRKDIKKRSPSFWKNSILTLAQIPIKNLSMKTCAINKPISEIKVLGIVYKTVGSKTKTIGNLYRGISLSFCFSAVDLGREMLVESIFGGALKLLGIDEKKARHNEAYIEVARKFFDISTKASLFIPYNFLLDCYIVSPAEYSFIRVIFGVILREQLGINFNIKGLIYFIFKLAFKVLFAPFTLFSVVKYLIGSLSSASTVAKESVVQISSSDQINNLFYAALPTLLLFVGKKLIRNTVHLLELKCNQLHQNNPNNQFYKHTSQLFSNFYFRGIVTGILNCPLEVIRLHYVGTFIQSYIDTVDYLKIDPSVDRTNLLAKSIPMALNPISTASIIINSQGVSQKKERKKPVPSY
ncbi:hypothetical protein DICPUDRAFT_149439 [Dictyostelium purpureum]|uniref:Uncharacterized protein n=1 Tax=Dictyostelium purpureum TaxID=5786 RepID=F0ZDR1_DICPU|nr:uncharacterized protein DICPUDRAFT_149439 [Dictyostelium purpureum]EGC37891.1 hypothetical protein DICPUDRAFT_149439 [Dictyostelium purpureum]|eukprot:XP_003285551.1 hypothetical protein DICPUDRAFT_149439 [Dictyostelium purpureum]